MAFGSGLEAGDEVLSDINMVPLIDVMLVMLIIFIITVPVLTHTVPVDLPRASNVAQPLRPETVSLAVTADGRVHWNEDAVDAAQLALRLAEAAARAPQPEIHLRGDRQVAYEHVARVMAAVQRAGLVKLGFVTDPTTAP